jgi:hypothetical protein
VNMAAATTSSTSIPDRRRRRSSPPIDTSVPSTTLLNGNGHDGSSSSGASPQQKRYRSTVVSGSVGREESTATIVTSLRSLSVSPLPLPINGTHTNESSSSTTSNVLPPSAISVVGLQCGLCHQLLNDPVQLSACTPSPHVFCRQCLIAYTARPSSLPVSSPTAAAAAASSSTSGSSVGFPFSLFATPFKKLQTALSPRARRPTTPVPSSPSSSPTHSSGSNALDTRLCPTCGVAFTQEQVVAVATAQPSLYKRLHDYLATTRDLHAQVALLSKQLHDVTNELASVRELAEFSMVSYAIVIMIDAIFW